MVNSRIPFAGVSAVTNWPGPVSSTLSREVSGTASFKVTAAAEAAAGVVLAKAKTSLSLEIQLSNTHNHAELGHFGCGSKGQYAHARYVSWSKKVTYRKYRVHANCTSTTISTGTINYPTPNEGWYTWVDSSPSV